jgi:hypothetical protein
VQVEHLVGVAHGQVNGVPGRRRQLLQKGHRERRQGHFLARLKAQFDQLGAQ